MLTAGQTFPNLARFLSEVEQHEQDSNGAFEVQTTVTTDGTVITCKCSGALDTADSDCCAVIKALDQKNAGVRVLQANLIHSHRSLADTTSPVIIESNGDLAKEGTSSALLTKSQMGIQPVEGKVIRINDNDKDSLNHVPARSAAQAPVTDALLTRMLGVPRFYPFGKTNIKSRFIESDGRYICPFCSDVQSSVLVQIASHLQNVHGSQIVAADDYEFIPCFTVCDQVRRGRKTAHFHCLCGGTFMSDKALDTHRTYNCVGNASEVAGKKRRGRKVMTPAAKRAKQYMDDDDIYADDEAAEDDEEEMPPSRTASGRPARRAAKNFARFMQRVKSSGIVKEEEESDKSDDADVASDHQGSDDEAWSKMARVTRTGKRLVGRPPKLNKYEDERPYDEESFLAALEHGELSAQQGASFGGIPHIDDERLRAVQDRVYDPNERTMIDDPSEPWVSEVQQCFWSMENEQVGFTRTLEDLEAGVQKFCQLTKHSYIMERVDKHFGKDAVPASAKGYRILWEGLQGTVYRKQPILYDGIPFIIMAGKILHCSNGPDMKEIKQKCGQCPGCKLPVDCRMCVPCKTRAKSADYRAPCIRRRCHRMDELKRQRCNAKILLKEVLKFPRYKISPALSMEKSTVLLTAALNGGSVSYERRYYAIFPRLREHRHVGEHAAVAGMADSRDEDEEEEEEEIDWRGMSMTCEHCSAQFTTQDDLIRHLKASHNIVTNRECDVCGESFDKVQNLRYHQRTKHSELYGLGDKERLFHENLLRCAMCPLPCYTAGVKQLIAHYNSTHGALCEIHRAEFATMSDFTVWKGEIEARDGIKYMNWGVGKPKPDQLETYFMCAWQYQQSLQTVNDTERGRCCAYLSVREEPVLGTAIIAEYCIQHMGHPTSTLESQGMQPGQDVAVSLAAARLVAEGHTKGTYMCGICEQTFNVPQGLTYHLKSLHKNCSLCGELVEAESQLNWHMAVVHPESFLQGIEVDLTCSFCGLTLANRRDLVFHYATMHQQTCTVETRTFDTIASFHQWKKEAFGHLLCPESRRKQDGLVRLICRGFNARNLNRRPRKDQCRCPCFLNFYINRELKQVATEFCMFHYDHVADEISAEDLEVLLEEEEAAKTGKADECEPVSMDIQVQSETGSEAGQKLAEKLAEDMKKWVEQQQDAESAEQRLDAELDRLFKGVPERDNIASNQLPGADPLVCPDCSQRFASTMECRRHRKIEHTSTKCRYCNASFLRFADMVQHQKLVHPNQVKSAPFGLLCAMCGAKLDAYDELAYHYKDFHEINDCQIEFTVFENAADFYLWKAEVEIRTQNYFVRKRRAPTESDVTMLFSCMTGLKDARKDKERQCPAFMKACVPRHGGNVTVTYCLFHMGHDVNEVQFWSQVRKSIHGFKTFKHINRLRKPKEIGLASKNLDVGEGMDATRVFYEEEVSTSKEDLDSDLDTMMRLYWDTMQERLTRSGNLVLGVAEDDPMDGAGTDGELLEGESGERVCHVCQVTFRNRRAMIRHLRRMHDPEFVFRRGPRSKYSRPVRCLFCNMPMSPPAMKNLIQHYVNSHQQGIQMKIRMFRNEVDFNTWRDAVSGNVFRRNKWYATQAGEKRSYWTCKFSGHLQNSPAGVTEGHCPAWIFAQGLSNGNIQVTYCLYHIGHELNADGTANDIPPRYPVGKRAQERWGPYGSRRPRYEPEFLIGPEDEAGTALLALQDTFAQPTEQYIVDPPQEVDGVIVDGEVQMHQAILDEEDNEGMDTETETDAEPEITIEQDLTDVTPEEAAALAAQRNRASAPETGSAEETALRSQINVLVRSVDGSEREVHLSLQDFPLVEKEGKKFYALDEAALIEAVGQVMAKQGLMDFGEVMSILQAAGNDTEKIAALSLLPRLLQYRKPTSDEIDEFSHCFPADFFVRLLRGQVDSQLDPLEGDSTMQLQEVGLSVLAMILQFGSIACSNRYTSCLSEIINYIRSASCDTEFAALDDALSCLVHLSRRQENFHQICNHDLLQKLAELADLSQKIYSNMLDFAESEACRATVETALHATTQQLAVKRGPPLERLVIWRDFLEHFENQDLSAPAALHSDRSPTWCFALVEELGKLLASRASPATTQLALELTTLIFGTIGVQAFVMCPSMLQLAANLASVELQLALGGQLETLNTESRVVCRCCELLELMTTLIKADVSPIPFSAGQLCQLNETVVQAVLYLADLLVKCADEEIKLPSAVYFPIYRLVCAVFAEDPDLFLTRMPHLALALLRTAKETFDRHTEFDAVQLLLPALSHMSTDVALVKLLITKRVLHLLLQYLQAHYDDLLSAQHNSSTRFSPACTVVLNYCMCDADVADTADHDAVDAFAAEFVEYFCKAVLSTGGFQEQPYNGLHFCAAAVYVAKLMDPVKSARMKDWMVRAGLVLRAHTPLSLVSRDLLDDELKEHCRCLWEVAMKELLQQRQLLQPEGQCLSDYARQSGWWDEMLAFLQLPHHDSKEADTMFKCYTDFIKICG